MMGKSEKMKTVKTGVKAALREERPHVSYSTFNGKMRIDFMNIDLELKQQRVIKNALKDKLEELVVALGISRLEVVIDRTQSPSLPH